MHYLQLFNGGVDCESKAKEDYIFLQSMINPNLPFKVEDTGLTLCASHSFLGASIKGNKVEKMEVLDIVVLNDPEFCLECVDEGVSLNIKHKYYAQIQGEMIMSLPWCDFVV